MENKIFDLYLAQSSHTDDKFLKGDVGLFCVLCTLHSTVWLDSSQILIAAKRNLPCLLTREGFLWKTKTKNQKIRHLVFIFEFLLSSHGHIVVPNLHDYLTIRSSHIKLLIFNHFFWPRKCQFQWFIAEWNCRFIWGSKTEILQASL